MRLPKVESLIITVFILCIALWAVSKCSSKRSQIAQTMRETLDDEERPVRRDTVYVPQPAPQTPAPQPQTAPPPQTYTAPPTTPGVLPKLQNQPAQTATQPAPATQTAAPAGTAVTTNPNSKYGTLYVTIDGLKMRKTPGLKGDLVTKLDLYEQVYFLNKKSEKTETISLGYEKVTDYWVKIRTKSGKEGWVFGAGVHYYKMKRKGVIE